MIKNAVILFGLTLWPLSLFLANTPGDFIKYVLPVVLLLASFILFKRQKEWYLLPTLLIPFAEPKLALLPLSIAALDLVWTKKRTAAFLLLLSSVSLMLAWKSFAGQTIFVPDYEARQAVISKTYLYPHPLLARTFHNKARIPGDKAISNFFALTDPNNYFFGFHPREIVVDNQNLTKFPFIGLIFVLLGLYHLGKSKEKQFIINVLIGSLFSLSILSIFDRNDFILWLPLGLLFLYGLGVFNQRFKTLTTFVYWIFLLFAIPEFVRLFLI